MSSVNKVILLGRLGRDPEYRASGDGTGFVNVTLATSSSWKDKASGEKKEATEWHNIVFVGRLAEIARDHLRKGSQVYVEGSLRTRKWQDKEGRERQSTEIVVGNLQMLGAPAERKEEQKKPEPKKAPGKFDDMEDDVPF